MMEPVIRAATSGDLPAVLALLRQLDPRTIAPGEAAAQLWARSLESGRVTMVVADVDGHLAATCMVVLVDT